MAIDYTTDLGKVRAAIPDISADPVLTDDQITAFLSVAGDNIYGAIAMSMRAIATEMTLLYKYVKTDDLLVDGPKMALALLESAKSYEGKASVSSGFFTLVPSQYVLEDPWYSLEVL